MTLNSYTLAIALRILCLASSVILMLALWRHPSPVKASKRTTPIPYVFAGVVVLFLAAYAYQATWQLAGFMRPRFVSFMRRYNRRPNNPVGEHSRGVIMDRNRLMLAGPDSDGKKRIYPLGASCAHLVGYSVPVYGNSGIERAAADVLTGTQQPASRDLGELGRRLVDHSAVRGQDVYLTIDARLQDNASRLLNGRGGAVVCIRPADGAVLALASSPSFDPNRLSSASFKAAGSPMFNRAVQGLYPPGSTFKIVVATAAIEKGRTGKIDCPGDGYSAGRGYSPIRDHEYYAYQQRNRRWRGHGRIEIREAFAKSSNVYFAKLGVQLGGAALQDCAARFGVGRSVHVFDAPSGSVVSKASRLPSLSPGPNGPVAQCSIGQGALLVTPLQMAMIASAIANDGKLYAPHTNARTPPRLLRTVTTPKVAAQVKDLMERVVQSGTARGARIWGLPVAGKTGTAQTSSGADHSWFVCFAPVKQPAIAMAVLVEHGGYGSAAALPIATELLKQCRELGLLDAGETR